MSWESFVNFIVDNGVAIITAALIGIAGSVLVNAANNRSIYKEVKSEIEKMKSDFGDVLNKGSMTVQNDRISGEIRSGSEKAEKSFEKTDKAIEKLDSSVSSLVISDAEKKKDLEYLSKDQRQMLLSVEALGRDYTQKESEINRLLAKIAGFEERERNRNLRVIELEGIIRELSDELEALRCEEAER